MHWGGDIAPHIKYEWEKKTPHTLLQHFKQYNDDTVQCLVPMKFSTRQLYLIKKNPLRPSVFLVMYLPKQVKPCLKIEESTFPYHTDLSSSI